MIPPYFTTLYTIELNYEACNKLEIQTNSKSRSPNGDYLAIGICDPTLGYR